MDGSADALLKDYKLEKYYGFNPVVKRTVADYIDSKGKKLRVAKGIVSKVALPKDLHDCRLAEGFFW